MSTDPVFDERRLAKLAAAAMPFGKYAGVSLLRLPEHYLAWWSIKGWPEGELGDMMREAWQLKQDGLDGPLRPLMKDRGDPLGRRR